MKKILRAVIYGFLFTFLCSTVGYSQTVESLSVQLEVIQRTSGRNSKETAQVHIGLGDVQKSLNNLVAAEEHYMAAVLILSDQLDARHPLVGRLSEVMVKLRHSDNATLLRLYAEVSEKYLGDADKLTASAQKNLADFYYLSNRLADAEQTYKRALEVANRAYETEDPAIVGILDPFAEFYLRQSRFAEALPLYRRALSIAEKTFGASHPEAQHYRQFVLLAEKSAGHQGNSGSLLSVPSGSRANADVKDRVQSALMNKPILGVAELTQKMSVVSLEAGDQIVLILEMAQALESQSRYSEALAHYVTALALIQTQMGGLGDVEDSIVVRAQKILRRLSHADDTNEIVQPTLALFERIFNGHNGDYIWQLYKLATLFHSEDFPEAALVVLNKARRTYNDNGLSDVVIYSKILQRTYEIYFGSGRFLEAEDQAKQLLLALEGRPGGDDINLAIAMLPLAQVLMVEGSNDQAEAYIRRGLKILQNLDLEGGGVHAQLLQALAVNYGYQGKHTEALKLMQTALEYTVHGIPAPSAENMAGRRLALGSAYAKVGQNDLAESNLKQAIEIIEATRGANSNNVASGLTLLAALYKSQKRFSEAEKLYQRAIAIHENAGTGFTEMGAEDLVELADMYGLQGHVEQAYPLIRQYGEILSKRFDMNVTRIDELTNRRKSFFRSIELLSELAERNPVAQSTYWNEAFSHYQLAIKSETSGSLMSMSARASSSNPELAAVVRKRQDSALQIQHDERRLGELLTKQRTDRDTAIEKRLRENLQELKSSVNSTDRYIAERFPKYFDFVKESPLGFESVKQLLRDDEALVAFLVGKDKTYSFVIRKSGAWLVSVKRGQDAIRSSVEILRQRLGQDVSSNRKLRPYDAAEAFALYEDIFAPIEQHLNGVRNIMLVLDGPLQSLPLATLVTEKLSEKLKSPEDHRKVAWLANRYSFMSLPSVAALRALRLGSTNALGSEPFQGFGDPLLEGLPGEGRGARSIAMGSLFRSRRAIADVDAIRQLAPLPDTAEELQAIANALNADPKSIHLRKMATESQVKQMNLAEARVIAFSTHAAMAGELQGYSEPGLILTPPRQGSELDDGYLSASEIAQLKLNTDWVLLSACNTAAPNGKSGAEGLSGLAKAFFYAGARSLLVSHWSVDSNATRQLVTNLLSTYSARREMGKSEALRQASLRLMNDDKRPYFAHPYYWAPFVVAGEGGAN